MTNRPLLQVFKEKSLQKVGVRNEYDALNNQIAGKYFTKRYSALKLRNNFSY